MAINSLDSILNTTIKVKIIRLFVSHTDKFRASGREIAKRIKVSPPAVHTALKELYAQGILRLEIIGKQHIYSLNSKHRIVKDILKPTFKKEAALKEDIKNFLLKKVKEKRIKHKLTSLILYGSFQRGKVNSQSDIDIAVIVKEKKDIKEVEDKFIEDISSAFSEYFGIHLDAYIKSRNEFIYRMRRHLSPVASLMKSYFVIFGKDPLELI